MTTFIVTCLFIANPFGMQSLTATMPGLPTSHRMPMPYGTVYSSKVEHRGCIYLLYDAEMNADERAKGQSVIQEFINRRKADTIMEQRHTKLNAHTNTGTLLIINNGTGYELCWITIHQNRFIMVSVVADQDHQLKSKTVQTFLASVRH